LGLRKGRLQRQDRQDQRKQHRARDPRGQHWFRPSPPSPEHCAPTPD
jgi:hypothetical protein